LQHRNHSHYQLKKDDLQDLSSLREEGLICEPEDLISEIALANMLSSQSKWRAKLYQLNNKGSWDDFGTGEFQIVKDVSSRLFHLFRTTMASTTCS